MSEQLNLQPSVLRAVRSTVSDGIGGERTPCAENATGDIAFDSLCIRAHASARNAKNATHLPKLVICGAYAMYGALVACRLLCSLSVVRCAPQHPDSVSTDI